MQGRLMGQIALEKPSRQRYPTGMALQILLEEIFFFAASSAVIIVALYFHRHARPFPGSPRARETWFRIWFALIWLLTIFMPLGTLIGVGLIGGNDAVTLALTPYFGMIALQIGWERVCLDWRKSPVWAIVPCLYLPWRLYQTHRGFELVGPDPGLIVWWTLAILFAMWVINIGVHFCGIPDSLQWNRKQDDPA